MKIGNFRKKKVRSGKLNQGLVEWLTTLCPIFNENWQFSLKQDIE